MQNHGLPDKGLFNYYVRHLGGGGLPFFYFFLHGGGGGGKTYFLTLTGSGGINLWQF